MLTDNSQRVIVQDGNRVVAEADVSFDPDFAVVRAWLHIEAGHLPQGTRTRLVDAVLALPEVRAGARLQAALPAGDGEIVDRVRQRCTQVQLRAAGVSCLLEGTFTKG